MQARSSNLPLRSRRGQRGATFIELALTAGIFFSILFGMLWFGRGIGARSNLNNSIGDGLRFGVTRGRLNLVNDLNLWLSGGAASPKLNGLLCMNIHGDGSVCGAVDSVDILKGNAYRNLSYNSIPYSHWLAMISVHEYMRVREGANMVNYPCTNRAGCLSCHFLNPASMGDASVGQEDTVASAASLTPDFIGIKCSYRADYGLLGTVFSMLGMNGTSNPFVITRSYYVNRYKDS